MGGPGSRFAISQLRIHTSFPQFSLHVVIMPNIKLRSSDEDIIEVDIEVAKMSRTIRTMMENLGIDESEDVEEELPLLKVDSVILKKVLEWATHHKDDPQPTPEEEEEEDFLILEQEQRITIRITEWDRRFLQVDQPTLFDIIQAANYLDIKVLLDVATITLADLIKGKTSKEIQDTFSIKKDATPKEEEEEEQAQKEKCEERK